METDESAGRADRDRATAFSERLSALKERGSMLLVVGPATHDAVRAACHRLLGDPTETRRRLFVRTAQRSAADSMVLPLDGAGDRLRTITFQTPTRSAAASTADDSPIPTTPVDGDLGDLLAEIGAATTALAPEGDALEPAALRICIDSADALVDTHDERDVFQFLHGVAGLVRSTRAMCHVHLPAPLSATAVQTVAPLFDAVVEVRDEGGVKQRWHLPDDDLTTDWLLL